MDKINDFWAASKCSKIACTVLCWHKKTASGHLAASDRTANIIIVGRCLSLVTLETLFKPCNKNLVQTTLRFNKPDAYDTILLHWSNPRTDAENRLLTNTSNKCYVSVSPNWVHRPGNPGD